MNHYVKGRNFYPGYIVHIFCERTDRVIPSPREFQIVALVSGSGFIGVNKTRLFVEAPGVLCFNGDETVEVIRSDGFSCRTVYFMPDTINSALTRETVMKGESGGDPVLMQDLFWLDPFTGTDEYRGYVRLGPASALQVSSLLDSLERSLDEQPDEYWPCRSRSFFLELLFFIRNLAAGADDSGLQMVRERTIPSKVGEILLFLHGNYRSDITLSMLCERFALNRTSLNELFRKYTGATVMQYLIALRVNLACLLLRDTTVPVKELVDRAGFHDVVNFNRTFKKRTSRTPMEYRNEFNFMLKGAV